MENQIKHISGAAGGYLVGNAHTEGGIKAINKAVGKPLEMEGGEVVITKPAVEDEEKREFEGEMLTNRQILSKINESGGGVSFAEKGAELPTELHCSGSMYKYGGESLTDYDILHKISKCGCQHDNKDSYADGGQIDYWLSKQEQFKDEQSLFENIEHLILLELKNRNLESQYKYTSKSKTEFGQSWYIKFDNELEIRISDHSLQSMIRIFDEKYVDLINVYSTYEPEMAKVTIDRYIEKSKIKETEQNKRNNAFDKLELRRIYIQEKSKEFLEKLKSENKGIFEHGHTRITLAEFPIKYPQAEFIKQISSSKGGFQYYYIAKSNGYGLKYVPPLYFNYLVEIGEINAEKVEEKTTYKKGGEINKDLKKGNIISNQTDDYQNIVEEGDDLLIPGDLDSSNLLAADIDGGNAMFEKGGAIQSDFLESKIGKKLRSDTAFLVGLQDAKQNNRPSGGWDINLFKSSFYNKVKNLDVNSSTEILDFLTALEQSSNVKPIFSKNHKIWGKYEKTSTKLDVKNNNKNELNYLWKTHKIKDVEERLINVAIENIPKLLVSEIINLSDKIAAHDKKERDAQTTAEAIQYLTQDFTNFDRDTAITSKENIKRLEDLGIIEKSSNTNEFDVPEGGNYQFKNKFGSFTSVKVMLVDASLRPSNDYFSLGITQRKLTSNNRTIIQTKPLITMPIKEYKPYMTDLKNRVNQGAENFKKVDDIKSNKNIDSKNSSEIIELTISPDNNLSKQLVEQTGDYWNAHDFANIDESIGDISFMKPFYHKETGKKFVVIDPSIKPQETRKPKYKVGDYVKYTTGDIERENWQAIVKEVKDFGSEFKYKLDAYTINVKPPMFDSEKTNEAFEVSLKPSTKTNFELAKNLYELNKHVSIESETILDTNYKVQDYKNPYEVNRAIETLLDSKPEDSFFTPNEKDFIAYYSGYGGLQNQGTFSDDELKGLLYEYYTPDEIVKKMWALAYKYGFGSIIKPFILEPSVGTGNFFKYAPKDAELFANEINKYSKKICEILYPTATIALQPFEKNFIERNNSVKSKIQNIQKYDIVIGNPPYGAATSKYLAMGESDYTKARNFTEYFITRGLDILKPDGLLIFVVGAEQYNGGTLFLDSAISDVKKEIFKKAQLVDAYRLPTKIFERTGVASEILVFKKY